MSPMRERRPLRSTALAVLGAVALASASDVAAATYENDIRIRAGTYSPTDLPTNQGLLYGLEVRNRLTERDGLYYGIAVYDDQRSVQRLIGANEFTLEADVTLLPLTVGWIHYWDLEKAGFYGGGGLGLYEVEAFSGGFSKQAGSQIVDVDEFRLLTDESRVGFQIFAGVDFLPASRIGFMLEARGHAVEDDFGGFELSTGALLRF